MAAAASAASAAAARIGAVLSDAQYFESGMVRVEDIRRLLDSNSLKDKLDAMKRVVALISLGRDASVFFPDVVKNVVAPSLDVKKLVYLYLVHYAEDKQDLALLSVNSFQKDISDHNELIRALALRVLSSIRVKVILQIVILAINKCAKDPSPYVRKAAAHAISKVISLDAPSREVLVEPLSVLLNDRSLEVLGSAVAVLDEVSPDRLDLVHRHFRYLCRSLQDMDPCSQVAVLRLLLRYARTQFAVADARKSGAKGIEDPDLAMLLSHTKPLLMSQYSSVVLGVVSILFHLSDQPKVVSCASLPLMRLASSSDAGVQYVALRTAADFAALNPGAILPYLSELFVSGADGASVRKAKIAVLSCLCETAGHPAGLGSDTAARRILLNEFQSYLYRSDKALAAGATRALGYLAAAHPPSTSAVMDLLASVVAGSTNALVVSESVTVLRRLLQLHPEAQTRALPKLMSLLLVPRDSTVCIAAAEARAAIIWLIGEFYDKVPHVAPEALRLLAKDFRVEEAEVKLQILSLAAKVVCWERQHRKGEEADITAVPANTRRKLLDYVTSCGIVDTDYDVRDKSRVLRNILLPTLKFPRIASSPEALAGLYRAILGRRRTDSDEANAVRSALKQPSKMPSAAAGGHGDETPWAILGSLSHVLGSRMEGCRFLPQWASESSATSLRAKEYAIGRSGGGVFEADCVSSVNFASTGPYSHQPSASINGGVGLRSCEGGLGAQGVRISQPQPRFANPERFYESESCASSQTSDAESSAGSSYETESDDEGNAVPRKSTEAKVVDRKQHALSGVDETALVFEALNTLPANGVHAKVSTASMPSKGTSRLWQTVIQGWNASGVELELSFLPVQSRGAPAATHMAFRVTNTGRIAVSKLSVRAARIDFEDSVFNDGMSLAAGEAVEFIGSCRFAGRTAPVSVALVDGEQEIGSGEIRPHAGQVLCPLPSFSYRDFDAREQSLGGMFGSTSDFTVHAPDSVFPSGENAADLTARSCRAVMLETARFTEIHAVASTASTSDRVTLRFTGYLPSAAPDSSATTSELVLVRLAVGGAETTRPSAVQLTLWVGCENVMYANTLLQLLKRELLSKA
jgi:AP-3 complex subunit beta